MIQYSLLGAPLNNQQDNIKNWPDITSNFCSKTFLTRGLDVYWQIELDVHDIQVKWRFSEQKVKNKQLSVKIVENFRPHKILKW